MRPQWEWERGNFALAHSPVPTVEEGSMQHMPAPIYCGEATQTATRGVFEGLGAGPQETLLSLRYCA